MTGPDQLAGAAILLGLVLAYIGGRRAWNEWLGNGR